MKLGYLLYDTEVNLCGINRLMKGYLKEIANNSLIDASILGYDYFQFNLFKCLPAIYENLDVGNRLRELKTQIEYNNYDIVHSFFYPLPKCDKTKTVLTVHDLIALVNEEWFNSNEKRKVLYEQYLKRACKEVDCIIAISECTKRDIVKFYDVNPDKIKVVYNGLYQILQYPNQDSWDNAKTKFSIKKPYILSICTIEPRKNLLALIKAYEKLRDERKDIDIQLLLVGRRGWKNEAIYQHADKSKYCKDIIFTDYVSDEELELLYANTLLFAYVSLYEGFGLPIIEAMAKGDAVLTSNVTSLPEVGGDAVCYCDPYDIDSIKDGLERIICDDAFRVSLQKKAIQRANLFTYEKMVTQTMEIYNSLLI